MSRKAIELKKYGPRLYKAVFRELCYGFLLLTDRQSGVYVTQQPYLFVRLVCKIISMVLRLL
jgi:hypothetical protein